MDKSKKYIEMCKAAPMIQECAPETDPYYVEPIDGDTVINKDGHYWFIKERPEETEMYDVWLSQQDQLQEMIYSFPVDGKHVKAKYANVAFMACINVACEELSEFSDDDCDLGFETFEQVWLGLVMSERYNQVWNKTNKSWEDK